MSANTDFIIYKLSCKNETITYTYIGHTKCFTTRKSAHKSDCCKEHKPNYNFPLYKYIRENGGWDNWQMTPIEKINCDLMSAKIREQYWIEQQQNRLNTKAAFITEEDAKSKAAVSQKAYCELNKEDRKEKRQEYKKNNAEKIAQDYSVWYQANKEKRRLYNEEYRRKQKVSEANV